MSDDWIDKNELQNLVSGFARTNPGHGSQGADDIFDDIPSQSYQEQPALPHQPQNHSPLQVLVNPPGSPAPYQSPQNGGIVSPFELDSSSASPPQNQQIYSPFSLDDDDDSYEDIEERIEKLTSEAERALAALQEAKLKAHTNGLLRTTDQTSTATDLPQPPDSGQEAVTEDESDHSLHRNDPENEITENEVSHEVEEGSDKESASGEPAKVEDLAVEEVNSEEELASSSDTEEEEAEVADEKPSPLDRIPLEVEIDPHLSLKGRLGQLCDILIQHVEMREILVVDRNGFALFETEDSQSVERSVASYLQSIRGIYQSNEEERELSASQLRVGDGEWLCLIPTDGQIKGMFLLKGIVPQPLDRPELYLVIELLNEVLRPDSA